MNTCKLNKKFNAGLCTIRYNAAIAKCKAGKPFCEECAKCEVIREYIDKKEIKPVIDLTEEQNKNIKVIKTNKVAVKPEPVKESYTNSSNSVISVNDSQNVNSLISKYNEIIKSAKQAYNETIEKAEKIREDIRRYCKFLEDLKNIE